MDKVKKFMRRIARRINPPPKRFGYPWKILCILRDTQDGANVIELILTRMGLEVTMVFDAQEALELMRATPPDVVLLDEPTSAKNKYQVYNAIKADDALRQIPLIFIGSPPRGHWTPPGRDKTTWPCGPQELFGAIKRATGSTRPGEPSL